MPFQTPASCNMTRAALGFWKGLPKPMRAQGGARAGARIHTESVDHFMITLHARLEKRPKPHARKTAQGRAQESTTAGEPLLGFRTTSKCWNKVVFQVEM